MMMYLAKDYKPYVGETWALNNEGERQPLKCINDPDTATPKPKSRPRKRYSLSEIGIDTPIQLRQIPKLIKQSPYLDTLSYRDIARLLGLDQNYFYSSGSNWQKILKRFVRLYMRTEDKGRLSAIYAFFTLLAARYELFMNSLLRYHEFNNGFYDFLANELGMCKKSISRLKQKAKRLNRVDISDFLRYGDKGVRGLNKRRRVIIKWQKLNNT